MPYRLATSQYIAATAFGSEAEGEKIGRGNKFRAPSVAFGVGDRIRTGDFQCHKLML